MNEIYYLNQVNYVMIFICLDSKLGDFDLLHADQQTSHFVVFKKKCDYLTKFWRKLGVNNVPKRNFDALNMLFHYFREKI